MGKFADQGDKYKGLKILRNMEKFRKDNNLLLLEHNFDMSRELVAGSQGPYHKSFSYYNMEFGLNLIDQHFLTYLF